jgi:release factor glutamine methyltransferase
MRVQDASRWAMNELANLESPRLEVDILLCHLMKWERYSLYLHYSTELDSTDLESFRRIVIRRKNREPLQHITGVSEFLGREFIAGPDALVPRPETETLAELFISKLAEKPCLLLDAGTGSGILAASLALQYPSALVIGSDVSRAALSIAAKNMIRHGIDNVQLVEADLLKPFKTGVVRFDGVIANLPYIPSTEIDTLEPEVSYGDPRIALDGGNDGLDLVQILLEEVPFLLKKNGVLALELASDQVLKVAEQLSNDNNWCCVEYGNDLTGRRRVVLANRT